MPLEQQIAAQKAAADAAKCYKDDWNNRPWFVEFRTSPHSVSGFPYAELCHYILDTAAEGQAEAPERLWIAFSTADMVIVGVRLAKLAQALAAHTLAAVSTLEARYAGTLGREPWIAKITVSKIGKGGGDGAEPF